MQALPDKPDETPESTLRALWHLATGNARSLEASIEPSLPELDPKAMNRLVDLVEQRLAGTPLAHLTGMQRFMGIDLLCSRDALIPRKETELLGYEALRVLRKIAADRSTAVVLDVCTGSGNLAVAMAYHEPKVQVYASDLSANAVALARKNAAFLCVGARVQVREGDLLTPFDTPEFHGRIDVLLCNPPYISSGKVDSMPAEISGHEPRLAFDGGPYGIGILVRLIRDAPRFLRAGALLAFEVGKGQGPGVVKLLQKARFSEVRPLVDEQGDIRAVAASA